MVTRGQRRLGRTIRNLENSVELSAKENKAKESEKKYKETIQVQSESCEDSPVQNLRYLAQRRNPEATHE